MPLTWYCYDCTVPLTATQKRCVTCGGEAFIAPGETLNSGTTDYEIVKLLGKGGMGAAYKATDNTTGTQVVVKHMFEDPDPAIQAENLKRFQREALAMQTNVSPYFPAGSGYFSVSGLHFMAMEFVPGHDLEQELKNQGGKLTEVDTLQIIIQVCEGITVMHEHTDAAGTLDSWLHRDIKPGNIMLEPSGHVKVLDFGIARPEKQTAATMARVTAVGTMEYVAIEQYTGTPFTQSDQYSIAATAFHLVMGYTLPNDFNLRQTEVNNLPLAWQPAFRQALDNDYNLRFPTVRDFQAELIALLPAGVAPSVAPAIQPLPAGTGGGAPTPVPTPVTPAKVKAPVYKIKIVRDAARWLPSGNWRQPVTVKTFKDRVLISTVIVIADTAGVVKTANVSPIGHFLLHDDNITHPPTVLKQRIQLGVKDPATNTIVCRSDVTIKRPHDWSKAKSGAKKAGHVAAQAKWIVKGPLWLLKWPFVGLWKGGNYAYQNCSAPTGALALAILLLIVTLFIAWLQKRPANHVWALNLWPHTLLAACYVANLARHLARQKPLPAALRRSFLMNALAVLWVFGWTGWWLR